MIKSIIFNINKIYTDKNNLKYTILKNEKDYIETINSYGIKKRFGKTILNNIEVAYDFEMNPFMYAGSQKKEDLDFDLITKRKSRKEMSKLHSNKLNLGISFIDII